MNYIIADFQHRVPAFMADIAEEAKREGHSVTFLTAVIEPGNGEAERVRACGELKEISNLRVILHWLRRPWFLLRREIREDIRRARSEHTCNRNFLITYLKHVLVSNALSAEILRTAKKRGGKCIAVATWFHVEAYAIALAKSRRPDLVTVALAHSFEVNPDRNRYITCMQNRFRHAYIDQTIFISETVFRMYRDKMAQTLRIDDLKSRLMYLGSHNPTGAVNPPAPAGSAGKVIVTCSACVMLKRVDLMLACFAKGLIAPDVRWVHIGDGSEFARQSGIAQKINEKLGREAIVFAGRLNNLDVLEKYRTEHFDLFINMSTVEGLPVSVMEALSFGIPVLATDVGGTHEIVDETCGGLLPAKLDPELLAGAIADFFSKPEETVREMRENARRRWKERFDAAENVPAIIHCLDSLGGTDRDPDTQR